MSKGQWYTIAEIYRNREHAVLQFIQKYLTDDNLTLDDLKAFFESHVNSTGRSPQSPLEIKELSDPDADARAKLLALLAPSQGELEAHIPTGPKLNKDGKPRKQRSDKGKKRGSYKT